MSEQALSFAHRFVPGAGAMARNTLLLLHGTGGNENDLLALGAEMLPGAALLSPRGKVLENGMPRFFRRLAEGVFDLEDLQRRTHELAEFLKEASQAYGLEAGRMYAVGFSNGANIAGALLLLRPESLAGGALLRPMVPLVPEVMPDLRGKRVLVAGGQRDPIVSVKESERLVAMLSKAGADVSTYWSPGGHPLTQGDIEQTREWFEELDLGSG